MATDATGTPTSNGIPTYATNIDAPSGKGFNAAMATLDTLVTSALRTVFKKAGATIGTRRGVNWTDTTLISHTVADDAVNDAVNVSSTIVVPSDTTKFLRGDGTWSALPSSVVSIGTALPGSPTDGQQFILVDTLAGTPAYSWLLQWNTSLSKWLFIGGSEAVLTGTPNATVTAGTQVGATGFYYPTASAFTTPRAGVYQITSNIWLNEGGNATGMDYSLFTGTALLADTRRQSAYVGGSDLSFASSGKTGAVAASTVIGAASSPGSAGVIKQYAVAVKPLYLT